MNPCYPSFPRSGAIVLLAALFFAAPNVSAQTIPENDNRPDDPPEGDRRSRLIEERMEKARFLHPPEEPGWFEEKVRWVEEQGFIQGGEGPGLSFYGFRPVVGGLRAGAGTFTGGIRFEPIGGPPESPVVAGVEARASLRGYYGFSGELGYVPQGSPFVAYGYGQYWHMADEDFFGLGADASLSMTDYVHDQGIVGGLVGITPVAGISIGGTAAFESNAIDGEGDFGADGIFSLPGVGEDLDYYLLGGFLEFDFRDGERDDPLYEHFAPLRLRIGEMMYLTKRGVYLSGELLHYLPTDSDQPYQFTRLNVEAEQYIPIRDGFQVFAFREFTSLSFTEGDNEVPYYLMRTIGGSHTVRGYDTFRFRDRHVAVVNAEYRWRVWLFLDMALFADAGYVFDDFDQLNEVSYGDLARSIGLGFRFHTSDLLLLQLDFAYSTEGFKVYFRLL